MKYTVATALLCASASLADPCLLDPGSDSYGIEIPTLYPYDECVLVQVYSATDALAIADGPITLTCTETIHGDNLIDEESFVSEDCGGIFDGYETNATGLSNFTSVDEAGEAGTFVTNYTVSCALVTASGLNLYTKVKDFSIVVENNLIIDITGQVKTEEELTSESTENINLSDLVGVQLNGGNDIVIEEGRLSTMTFALTDKGVDPDNDPTNDYGIAAIKELTFEFLDPVMELEVTDEFGAPTTNGIAINTEYAADETAVISLIVPAGFFSGEENNVNVVGEVVAERIDIGRRREVVADNVPFTGSFTLTKSTASAGVSTAVSFITMMGVPATLIAAAGLF